jgi:hypothetical protein
LQWNIWWWCESWCGSKCTSLINPSKWILIYRWCSVTWTRIPSRSCIGWRWQCKRLMVSSWRSWTQKNWFNWLCVIS